MPDSHLSMATSRQNEPHRRGPGNWQSRTHEDEAVEPAWMDDDAAVSAADPAIVIDSDPSSSFKFVQGEDMIAAHRRAMNHRSIDGGWRADKPLVGFFGNEAPPPSMQPAKPKAFNAADYLLPSREAVEEEQAEAEMIEQPSTSAFQSRFQKFFGGPGAPSASSSSHTSPLEIRSPQSSQPSQHVMSPPPFTTSAPSDGPTASKPDDHMVRLMGLLSSKVSL